MRIGIVNDALIAAESLRRIVADLSGHSVVWIARDGAEAVEKCRLDTPDLVLMDLIMPVMDGVEATRRIMAGTPCPILVVTATMEGNCSKVFEALGAGALDAVQTPSFGGDGQAEGANALKFKIQALKRRTTGEAWHAGGGESTGSVRRPVPDDSRYLVAIGSSAGGPAALATILAGLPARPPFHVVIIQHIDAQFAASMVSWLNEHSKIPVRVALQGESPPLGMALMAGTNDHLAFLSASRLGYTVDPQDCPYRPSVDVFFESVVRHWRGKVVGVLLSGMGRDGARGLRSLRDAGAVTIAQDPSTSAVYGMPKAAVELKAAGRILPVHEIAGELTRLCRDRRAIT